MKRSFYNYNFDETLLQLWRPTWSWIGGPSNIALLVAMNPRWGCRIIFVSAIVWDRNRSPYVSNSKAWRHKFAAPEKKNLSQEADEVRLSGEKFQKSKTD